MKIKLLIFIFLSLCVIPPALSYEDSKFYQKIESDQSLKTFFLRRVANDVQPGDFPYDDDRNPYNTQLANLPKGIYLQTADSDDLNTLFTAVGRRIQLRLVK